jgi:hypothetical protein
VSPSDEASWTGIADFLLCCLGVIIVAVNPVHAKTDGVKPHADYLIQLDWEISRDIDLDLWVVGPSRKPVFYQSRQVGCANLDRDSLGFSTSMITLADGSQVRAQSNTETTTLRCIEPGHYDVAVNRFSDHTGERGEPITARVDLTGLNPTVTTLWSGPVVVRHVGETVNVISFDLSADGKVTLVSPPLEPVTSAYEKAKAGSAP